MLLLNFTVIFNFFHLCSTVHYQCHQSPAFLSLGVPGPKFGIFNSYSMVNWTEIVWLEILEHFRKQIFKGYFLNFSN